jgi:hypothetical protein
MAGENGAKKADYRHLLLLRVYRERPKARRTTE